MRTNYLLVFLAFIFLFIGILSVKASIKLNPEYEEEIKKWEKENASAIDKWEKENEKKLKAWEEANQKRIEKLQQFNARIRESWEYAMDNWDNLYFCHRDDCVFIPGMGTYAPIEEYDKYLYE